MIPSKKGMVCSDRNMMCCINLVNIMCCAWLHWLMWALNSLSMVVVTSRNCKNSSLIWLQWLSLSSKKHKKLKDMKKPDLSRSKMVRENKVAMREASLVRMKALDECDYWVTLQIFLIPIAIEMWDYAKLFLLDLFAVGWMRVDSANLFDTNRHWDVRLCLTVFAGFVRCWVDELSK